VASEQLKFEYVVCHTFLLRTECLCSCNALQKWCNQVLVTTREKLLFCSNLPNVTSYNFVQAANTRTHKMNTNAS